MSIDRAVKNLAECAYKTERSTAAVVRRMFSELTLSQRDVELLAMEGLTARVNSLLTSGKFESDDPKIIMTHTPVMYSSPHGLETGPTREPPASIKIPVDVQILHQTVFQVNGLRKPIVQFAVRDLDYMLGLYGSEIVGYQQRSDVFVYAKDRLVKLSKKHISDLATGEQTILARKWREATRNFAKKAVA